MGIGIKGYKNGNKNGNNNARPTTRLLGLKKNRKWNKYFSFTKI